MGAEKNLLRVMPNPYLETDFYPKRGSVIDYPEVASDVTMALVLSKASSGPKEAKVRIQIQKRFPGIAEHLTALTNADSNTDRIQGLLYLYGERLPTYDFDEIRKYWDQTLKVHQEYQAKPLYQEELAKVRTSDALESLIEANGKRWSRRKMLRYSLAGITGMIVGGIASAARKSDLTAQQKIPVTEHKTSSTPPPTQRTEHKPPTPPPSTAEFTNDEISAIEKGMLHLRPTRLVFAGGSIEGGSYKLAGVNYGPESFRVPYYPLVDLTKLGDWPEQLTAQGLNVPALFQAVADEYGARVVVFSDSVHDGRIDKFVDNIELENRNGERIQVRQVTRLDKSNKYLRRQNAQGKTEDRLIGEPLLFTSDQHSFVFIPRDEHLGSSSSTFRGTTLNFIGMKSYKENLGINELIDLGGPTGSLLIAGAYGAFIDNQDEGGAALISVKASWPNSSKMTVEEAIRELARWDIPADPNDFTSFPSELYGQQLLFTRYREIDDSLAQNGLYYIASEFDRLLKKLQVTLIPGSNYPTLLPYPFVTNLGRAYPANSKVTQEVLKRAHIDLP